MKMTAQALNDDLRYQAILEKDPAYDGLFYTAVKTTGIFCKPTCTARKPKRENVEFFPTTKDAMLHGYRPCKVCNPLVAVQETPAYVTTLLQELSADPSLKFKDHDLVELGIEPSKIRRWFLKHHGITFQAYQRIFRINSAFKKIQSGDPVTAVAFDSGYESLSGFADSFKSVFGISPSKSKMQQVIDMTRLETPLGPMLACAVQQGICLLEFTDRKMLETELKTLAKVLNATIVQGDNPHFGQLSAELGEYFEGKRETFTVPLFTPGTEFQQRVWAELQNIPYGSMRSYKEQSIALGNLLAIRAVAMANGMNRISIIIPCHRVIGSNGEMTGYGGGIWRKQKLLALEARFAGKKADELF
jgi:AraC family transcriptional regulator of adaptative response/methylated-DNA-[protein]-cysteine methyltransferase